MGRDLPADGVKEAVFDLLGLLVRPGDLFLQLLELRGGEALGVGQGLAADIAVRHQGIIGLRDLDIVAEHPVILDAQVFDAGCFAFPGFQIQEPLFPLDGGAAKLVQFGIVALADDARVQGGQRGLRGDRRGQVGRQFL